MDVASIKNLVEEGFTQAQIAEKLGKSKQQICRLLNKYHLKTKFRTKVESLKEINEDQLKKDVLDGMKNKELCQKYERNESTIRYWIEKVTKNNSTKSTKTVSPKAKNIEDGKHYNCIRCNEKKQAKDFFIRSDNGRLRTVCRACMNKDGRCKYIKPKTKNLIIEYKGGCCEICKYNKCEMALEVHHKNPETKEIKFSDRENRYGKSIDHIQKELDVSHLLCANHHREVHGGFYPDYIIPKPEEVDNRERFDNEDDTKKKCTTCDNIFLKTEFSAKNKHCKWCIRIKNRESARDTKKKCVEYKGGKCEDCGYNKYVGALEFHHLDSTKKDFAISRSGKYFGDYHRKELDKCVMLCANCHRFRHEKEHEEKLKLERGS